MLPFGAERLLIAALIAVAFISSLCHSADRVSLSDLDSKVRFDALWPRWLPFANRKAQLSEQECSLVDNRDDSLGEPREQGGLPWCFAFVAADLLSHKLKKQLSAVDVALNYNQLAEKQSIPSSTRSGGGLAQYAVALMSYRGGVCLEKDLPSRYRLKGAISLKHFIDDMEDFDGRYLNWMSRDALQEVFPNLQTKTIMDTMLRTGMRHRLHALAELNCAGRQANIPTNLVVQSYALGDGDGSVFLAKIDEVLERKSIVAIDFFPKFMMAAGSKPRAYEERGGHSASIVGRRWNPGSRSCEYVVRNSWGGGCKYYDSRVVHCNPTEPGYLSVSEKALMQNIESLHFIR